MIPRLKIASAFLFSLSLLFCLSAFAQESEKKVSMKDLPEPVRKTVQEQSKGAKVRGLTREVDNGHTYYEASLKVNGRNRDVLIDPSGAVVEVEDEVAMASLPINVRTTIEKVAGKAKIESVESITKNNNIVAYEAHVKTGGKESEIKVAANGELIPNEMAPAVKEDKPKQKSKKP